MTGWLAGSKTSALRAVLGGWVVIAIPGDPPGVAVETKVTGDPSSPETVAVVVCSPDVAPSTRCTEACPWASVFTVSLDTPPPPCALHWTLTPETGFPASSVTSTTRGLGNGCCTGPLWPLPLA